MTKFIKHFLALVLMSLLATAPAKSAVVSAFFSEANPNNNDCAGYFGDNFGSCTIFIDDNGQRIELSPVISKFDTNLDLEDRNSSEYPSISTDGSEWSFDDLVSTLDGSGNIENQNISGSWLYSPTGDDPGVRYWASKAGNFQQGGGFNLYWDVDPAAVLSMGITCAGLQTDKSNFNLPCLNLARTVDSGSWSTPLGKELSHLTFYNSDPPAVVPVPAAVWLFGTALIGFIGVSRRTKV